MVWNQAGETCVNLMDLCKDFLVYLVRFREKAPTPAAPTLQQARADVLGILDRMEVHTRREPSLALPFQRARYALVALADEVFCTSGWDRAREWRDLTLERQIFQTSRAGTHFFELIDQSDPNDQEMAAIYYLCLALGFTGRYAPDDPELAEYKRRLLARLPEEARPEIPDRPGPIGRKRNRPEPKPLPRPARWAVMGGLALLAAAALVGAGWLFSPDNFLPKEEKTVLPSAQARGGAADKAQAKAAPEPAGPKAAPEPPPKAEAKPEKRQLVLVPGRTVTASKPAPPPPEPTPEEAGPTPEKLEPKPAKAEAGSTPKTPPAAVKTKTAAQKRKAPAPKAKPPAKAKMPARGAYQVLVASFVGPKQSGRLANKLKAMGYPARVELLPRPGKETWYVVKVVPLKNKAEAARAASAIKRKLKLSGMVRPVE